MSAITGVVLGLLALSFCTWLVSLGGLAALQHYCAPGWSDTLGGYRGFSSGLACYSLFRYYWWIVALEFALIFALIGCAAGGVYAKTRLSFIGLFAVVTVLYIQMSDSFLGAQSWSSGFGGRVHHATRAMVAGCIMTAIVDFFILIALGLSDDHPVTVTENKANAV